MDYQTWVNKALLKIGELDEGSTFVLKDLFPGVEWHTLARGEKLNLGRKFKANVDSKIIPYVVIVDSPKGTSTTHKKVK